MWLFSILVWIILVLSMSRRISSSPGYYGLNEMYVFVNLITFVRGATLFRSLLPLWLYPITFSCSTHCKICCASWGYLYLVVCLPVWLYSKFLSAWLLLEYVGKLTCPNNGCHLLCLGGLGLTDLPAYLFGNFDTVPMLVFLLVTYRQFESPSLLGLSPLPWTFLSGKGMLFTFPWLISSIFWKKPTQILSRMLWVVILFK